MIEKGQFSLKPIRFTSIEYFGEIGTEQLNTDYILSKLITQNILYSAYHQPKTIPEIAEILAIEPSIVEEEITFLESNGFINKISANKYLTSMFIVDLSDEISEELHQFYSEYAREICEKYVPLLMENGKWKMDSFQHREVSSNSASYSASYISLEPTEYTETKTQRNISVISVLSLKNLCVKNFYIPENDINFLMWSIFMFACDHRLSFPTLENELKNYQIIRNCGEANIAFTSLYKEHKLSYIREKYYTNGSIEHYYTLSELWPVRVWVYNTYYDDRQHGWGRSVSVDPAYLYHFIASKLNDKSKYNDIFEGLYKKGYLVSRDDSDYVNMVILSMTSEDLKNVLPPLSNELQALRRELDEKVYDLVKNQFPKQVKEQIDLLYKCCISKNEVLIRVLEQLLLNGVLKPITDIQKKTVNMIMFSPIKPD